MAATAPARRLVDAPRPRATGRLRAARAEATPTPSSRPILRIVPKPRSAFNAALVLGFVVVVLMLGTVVLHTRLAQRQVEIDRLQHNVADARSRFDLLRQQRAELRSPTRLSIEGQKLGMMPSPRTEFLPVDAMTVARQLAAAGMVDEITGTVEATDPLDEIRKVRAAGEDTG